jgi:DNA-binding response OmpR family regulator
MNATVKALYVEDNPMDADRLRHYFASAAPEFDVHIVGSGEACIASVQNNPYDILLLDCNLPDIDGLEVLDALRRQGCGIPIVMLTGRGDEELVVQALRAGVSDPAFCVESLVNSARNSAKVFRIRAGSNRFFILNTTPWMQT